MKNNQTERIWLPCVILTGVCYSFSDIINHDYQKRAILDYFNFPATLLLINFASCFCLYWPVALLGYMGVPGLKHLFPLEGLRLKTLLRLFPAAVVFAVALIFNLYTLKAVGLGRFDLMKGFTLLITGVLQGLVLQKRSGFVVWAGILIIALSFLLAAEKVSQRAVYYGVAASFGAALRSIMVAYSMKYVHDMPGRYALYNTFLVACILAFLAPLLDLFIYPQDVNPYVFILKNSWIWRRFLNVSLIGLSCQTFGFAMASIASPVTYHINNLVKATVMSAYGMWTESDYDKRALTALAVKVVGGIVYMVGKHRDIAAELPIVSPEAKETSRERSRRATYLSSAVVGDSNVTCENPLSSDGELRVHGARKTKGSTDEEKKPLMAEGQ